MPVLPIRKYGDDVLRRRTEPITTFDESLQRLIDDMVDTMYAAPGIGLAANQVGVNKRVAVIDLSVGKRKGELHALVNPEIDEAQGKLTEDEGCLSIPDFTEVVIRPERVHVRFLDRNGDARDFWGEGLMASLGRFRNSPGPGCGKRSAACRNTTRPSPKSKSWRRRSCN